MKRSLVNDDSMDDPEEQLVAKIQKNTPGVTKDEAGLGNI